MNELQTLMADEIDDCMSIERIELKAPIPRRSSKYSTLAARTVLFSLPVVNGPVRLGKVVVTICCDGEKTVARRTA